jgi:hypothetical protein
MLPLVTAWRTYQPYTPEFEWLGDLIELAKGNKHRRLTPQTRQERREVRWDAPGSGSSITLGEGASITMGPGADIQIGGKSIRDIQPTRTVYVDWLFDDTEKSALQTLKTIQAGIRPMLSVLCDLADL